MEKRTAIIIGAGIGGLATACLLAKNGWQVTVLEKNEQSGGRNWQFKAKGFTFDAGPSWYLMPDVFDHFFEVIGKRTEDFFELTKLSPGYRVFFADRPDPVNIFQGVQKVTQTFEAIKTGGGVKIKKYLENEAYKYEIAKKRFLYKNYDSRREFFTAEMMAQGIKLNVLSNIYSHVKGYFPDNKDLQKVLTFPSMFLGTSPYRFPALYGVLNHSLLNQGVFYPKGGMYALTMVLERVAMKNGAKIKLNSPVKKIFVKQKQATGVILENGKRLTADIVISNAGTQYTELSLLEPANRSYSKRYWQTRLYAPSALLVYLGVKGKLPSLAHHNLFFGHKWRQNFRELENAAVWPSDPGFYVSKPTHTDASLAPPGHENLAVLAPVAAGLKHSPKQLESYAEKILAIMETQMGLPNLRQKIVFKRLFGVKDFEERFNSPGGTALGLAHTLRQTAFFRPNNQSKKVKNLYFVGADTRPGIGLPMALISAELVYKRLAKK